MTAIIEGMMEENAGRDRTRTPFMEQIPMIEIEIYTKEE